MTIDFFTIVFLSSIMMGFGHVVSTAERLNVWKILLLLVVLVPFVTEFNSSKVHLYTMIGAFLFGFIFPRLRSYGFPSLSLPRLNIARLWQRSKPKPSKKQRQTRKTKEEKREQAYQKHQQESAQFRQSQTDKDKKKQSQQQTNNQHEKINKKHHQQQDSEPHQADFDDTIKQMAGYLETLGLSPDGFYSQADIKKAYQRQAKKYHPDLHRDKSVEEIKEMEARFTEAKRAYEWLKNNA